MRTSTHLDVADEPRLAPPKGNMPAARRISEDFEHLSGAVLLDDRQFAELTGYGIATIKGWRRQGIGPQFVLINGRPRVTAGAIREWLAGLPRAIR